MCALVNINIDLQMFGLNLNKCEYAVASHNLKWVKSLIIYFNTLTISK